MTTTWVRVAIGAVGVAAAGYGLQVLLAGQEWPGIRATAVWAAVAVVLHDAVLAPLVVGAGWLARRLLLRHDASSTARRVLAGAAVVVVVLGPVSLIALGVVGRLREGPTVPTLLERDYSTGWLVVAGFAVVAAVGLVWSGLVSSAGPERRSDGQSAGGR